MKVLRVNMTAKCKIAKNVREQQAGKEEERRALGKR